MSLVTWSCTKTPRRGLRSLQSNARKNAEITRRVLRLLQVLCCRCQEEGICNPTRERTPKSTTAFSRFCGFCVAGARRRDLFCRIIWPRIFPQDPDISVGRWAYPFRLWYPAPRSTLFCLCGGVQIFGELSTSKPTTVDVEPLTQSTNDDS